MLSSLHISIYVFKCYPSAFYLIPLTIRGRKVPKTFLQKKVVHLEIIHTCMVQSLWSRFLYCQSCKIADPHKCFHPQLCSLRCFHPLACYNKKKMAKHNLITFFSFFYFILLCQEIRYLKTTNQCIVKTMKKLF